MAAPVDLYIVRHGIAEDSNPEHPGIDHHRRLTEEGAARVADAARGALALGLVPDIVWSSPHVRAQQTATGLADVLAPRFGIEEVRELAIGHPVHSVIDRIELAGVDRLMVVGHNPQLGELASELVAGGRLRIRLKKAALVHVRLSSIPRGIIGELCGYHPARVLGAVENLR